MSRRHESLIPLSHDHHHALRNARLLRIAADANQDGRLAAARDFLTFFREDTVRHFREEEEDLFPRIIVAPGAPVEGIERVLGEHVRLHALVRQIQGQAETGVVDPDLMRALAARLREHVRFEEDELFPTIERVAANLL